MSGGYFDYKEWHLKQIVETIEEVIENNGTEKKPEDLFSWDYDKNTGKIKEENKYYYKYSPETIDIFKRAIKCLKMAYSYIHNIDYLLEGDINENDLLENIKEAIKKNESVFEN